MSAQNVSLAQALEIANHHHVAGDLARAEQIYKQILAVQPNNAMALHLLGVLAYQCNKSEIAQEYIKKALSISPDYADAHSNLGLVLKKMDQVEQAALHFKKATQLNPKHAEAYFNLGVIQLGLGDLTAAKDSLKQTISLKPSHAKAHNILGSVYYQLQLIEDAVFHFKKAVEVQPGYVEAYLNLGAALHSMKTYDQAISTYKTLLTLTPDDSKVWVFLGAVWAERARLEGRYGDADEALACYEKALQLNPDDVGALSNLGDFYEKSGQYHQAIGYFQSVVRIQPDNHKVYNNIGTSYQKLGQSVLAVDYYQKALSICNEDTYHSNWLLTLHYVPGIESSKLYEHHKNWSKKFSDLPQLARKRRGNNKKLKVAYISPDFRTHSVAYFFKPLLGAHDREVVEVYCYHASKTNDDMTQSLKELADHWLDVAHLSDESLAKTIYQDGIDILVDLAGHTAGNRLPVFACKPAPIQLTWLGYPNTTGLSTIDYRFTDEIADPEGVTDDFNCETLIRLKNGFLCYEGDKSLSYQKELPFRSAGYITFGSFNNLSKINDDVIKVWSEVLLGVPGSRLLLKSYQLGDPVYKEALLKRFAELGVDEGRLLLYHQLPKKEDHLTLYGQIDLGLDPFPYNGVTTTCEALWMGVPVVSLLGESHVSRVSASIMHHVGLESFIAGNTAEYVETAIRLANNPDSLATIRKTLRDKMNTSDLCNADLFARNVENAYLDMSVRLENHD